jgi:hypothetical protein
VRYDALQQEDIMLGKPVFLGFSMLQRSSRRRLVAVVYATLLALVVIISAVWPHAPRVSKGRAMAVMAWAWGPLLAYTVVTWFIFGKLAKDTVLPKILRVSRGADGGGEITSLGLAQESSRQQDDLDEREVAVRNAAYFTAYRAVAVYSYLVWMAVSWSCWLGDSAAFLLIQWLVMLLVAMVLTLPPAVVLWTEPDVPEEAQV